MRTKSRVVNLTHHTRLDPISHGLKSKKLQDQKPK